MIRDPRKPNSLTFIDIRTEIDRDYNGSWTDSEIERAMEYPVGDLLDDDTYWMDEDADEEE